MYPDVRMQPVPCAAARSSHRPSSILVLASLPALVLSACGGGGGGGDSGNGAPPALDEGALSVGDFGYVSERPPGFHPLRTGTASLVPRAELVAALPLQAGGTLLDGREGPDAAFAGLAGLAAVLGSGSTILALGRSNLDDDAADELVAVVRTGASVALVGLDRGATGAFSSSVLQVLSASSFERATLVTADLDHDQRDEFAVLLDHASSVAQRRLVLVDDLDTAFVLRHSEQVGVGRSPSLVAWHTEAGSELVVGASADDGRVLARRYRLQASGDLVLAHDWAALRPVIPTPPVLLLEHSSALGVGDCDGDGVEDLVVARNATITALSISSFDLAVLRLDPLDRTEVVAERDYAPPSNFPDLGSREWALSVRRRSGASAEFALYAPYEGHWTACRFSLAPTTLDWNTSRLTLPPIHASGERIAAAIGDTDSDGTQEVLLGIAEDRPLTLTHAYTELHVDGNAVTQTVDRTGSGRLASAAPCVTLADVDADGLVVRSTGLTMLRVATPIPLVLLAAPPTRAGIDQNHSASTTSYSHASGIGRAIEVSTRATLSAYVGYEVEDVFGAVGANGRTTIGETLARSDITSSSVVQVQSYTGAHDVDVIVFQGTLYESHEYVIEHAPDPAHVGLPFTIDLPVATRTYKWTVPYFDSKVAPEDRVDPALLPHTPGDPESYPRRAALAQELAGQVAWSTSQPLTVGQGSQSSAASIVLGEAGATTAERTFFVEFESGFKAGYATVGGSVGLEESHAYTVSYSEEATYTGEVGDIQSATSYEAFAYEFGFAVQNVGMARVGGAVVVDPSATPFQVVRYWVQPTGSAYGP
jgi:hypothetical protein